MEWTRMLKLRGNMPRNQQIWQNLVRKAVAQKRAVLMMMMMTVVCRARRRKSVCEKAAFSGRIS
jgi:isochorismate hydrolase